MKIIKFYADWCLPCKEYQKTWDEATEKFTGPHFIEKNIDKDLEAQGYLHAILGKHQIPTTLFIYEDGTTDVAKGALTLGQIERRLK